MAKKAKSRTFQTTDRGNVPTGRKGKHRAIVVEVMDNLAVLNKGQSLKLPIDELPDTVVNIRSALSRAAHKSGQAIATAADEEYLYIWNS